MKGEKRNGVGMVVHPSDALMTDIRGVAALLGLSVRHTQALDASGRLGPQAVCLGRSRRWSVSELRQWVKAGCPPRDCWVSGDGKDATLLIEGGL